jgi:hypothetical protein
VGEVSGNTSRSRDPEGRREVAHALHGEGCVHHRTFPFRKRFASEAVGARTVHTAVDLLLRRQSAAPHDPPVALQLIYLVFSKLLSWMVLRTRSDTTKDIEILVLRHQLMVLNGSPRPRIRWPDRA